MELLLPVCRKFTSFLFKGSFFSIWIVPEWGSAPSSSSSSSHEDEKGRNRHRVNVEEYAVVRREAIPPGRRPRRIQEGVPAYRSPLPT